MYFSDLITEHFPKIIFLQEVWLPYHDEDKLKADFPDFNFLISTPDMFMNSEEKLSSVGPVWHGSALGWHNDIQHLVHRIAPTFERFSGVILKSSAKNSTLVISPYAPTSGRDDDFLECIGYLSDFITTNKWLCYYWYRFKLLSKILTKKEDNLG